MPRERNKTIQEDLNSLFAALNASARYRGFNWAGDKAIDVELERIADLVVDGTILDCDEARFLLYGALAAIKLVSASEVSA